MKLCFDSMDELRKFMDDYDGDNSDDAAEVATGTATRQRRTRGPNKPKGEQAAAGQVGTGGPGFAPPPTASAPPAQGFPPPSSAPAATGFPPPAAPAAAPPHPLVAAITTKVDATLAAGSPADPVVAWFRTMLPGTEQANWEQIKASFLPKASEPQLMAIAGPLGLLQSVQ